MPDDETNEIKRELGAFWFAVRGMFGSEVAALAAADWLQIFETTNRTPNSMYAPYRNITTQAASRMAYSLSAEIRAESPSGCIRPIHKPNETATVLSITGGIAFQTVEEMERGT
jgi:hypothetical protein